MHIFTIYTYIYIIIFENLKFNSYLYIGKTSITTYNHTIQKLAYQLYRLSYSHTPSLPTSLSSHLQGGPVSLVCLQQCIGCWLAAPRCKQMSCFESRLKRSLDQWSMANISQPLWNKYRHKKFIGQWKACVRDLLCPIIQPWQKQGNRERGKWNPEKRCSALIPRANA